MLARNMNRMLKLFPKEFNIFPRTWCLPAEWVDSSSIRQSSYNLLNERKNKVFIFSLSFSYSDFQAYTRAKKHKTYICKPDAGCQGRGIYLTKSNKDIRPGEHMICQVYVSKVTQYS